MMQSLVIDRDESLTTTLISTFSKLGITTIRCDSITDAIARASLRRPNLFVLRWAQSIGIEHCESLRDFGIDNPILVALRRAGPHERAAALNAGADDCIDVPFEEVEVRAKVLALLRRRKWSGWGFTSESESNSSSAWNAVLQIELTRREQAIFRALARQRGVTVPRSVLLAEAFAIKFDPGTNVLDVHISHLRKKLRAVNAGLVIQSVRGVGYRIQSTQS